MSEARIQVHAQPGAKRTEVVGRHGENGATVKIRVHAPPVDGKANEELIRFLSDTLGVPRSSVSLIRGEKSRAKTFAVHGISDDQALALLLKSC